MVTRNTQDVLGLLFVNGLINHTLSLVYKPTMKEYSSHAQINPL